MNGLFSSAEKVTKRSNTRDAKRSFERDKTRDKLRDFILSVLDPQVSDEVVWSIPPTYPFDDENHKENSGFVF